MQYSRFIAPPSLWAQFLTQYISYWAIKLLTGTFEPESHAILLRCDARQAKPRLMRPALTTPWRRAPGGRRTGNRRVPAAAPQRPARRSRDRRPAAHARKTPC